jgi:hypothetical protein
VSRAYVESFGKRELDLFVEMRMIMKANGKEVLCIFPQKLRLGVKNFSQQLGNYFSLQEKMMADYRNQLIKKDVSSEMMQFSLKVIDLRMDKIALIE